MRRVMSVWVVIIVGAVVGLPVKASTALGQLANQFDAAWVAAGGVAPPLGVSLVDLTIDERTTLGIADGRGVRLIAVDSGSLGERLGLKANDIVVGLNGSPVRSGEEFVNLVRSRDTARPPSFELFTYTPMSSSASGPPAPPPGSTPIDCGPNPTFECAMQVLRESWSKLREAMK